MSRIDVFSLASQTAANFAVAGTASHTTVPVESVDPGVNRETIEVQETLGNRFPTSLDYGTKFYEVSASGAAHFDSFGHVLSSFFGSSARTVFLPAYKHVFDSFSNTASIPFKSMYVNRADPTTDIVDLFTDALGNTLTLTMEPNNVMRFDAGWVATKLDQSKTLAPTTVDSSPRSRFYDAQVQIVSYETATSTTVIPVSSWSVAYNNNIDTDNAVLGSTELSAIQVGNADCEISFTARDTTASSNVQELVDHYRRALRDSPFNNRVTLTANSSLAPGTATASYSISVDCFNVEYVSAPAAISAADVLKGIDVTGRCYGSGSKFVDITLWSGQAATYS